MKFAVAGLTIALCCAVSGAEALPVSSSPAAPAVSGLPIMKTVVVVKKVVRRPPPRRVVKKKVIIRR